MTVSNKLQFMLRPGRLVAGNLIELQTKDNEGQPLKPEKYHLFFAVAVPKNDPHVGGQITAIMQRGWEGYRNNPQVQEMITVASQRGFGAPGAFRFKIEDGDAIKHKDKQGWVGCWVFKFSTQYAPMKCCNAQNQQLDPAMIKHGYWVDVAVSCDINERTDANAGVYLNPNAVRLLGYGEEIVFGPSFDTLFGGQHGQLPQGASATPLAPPAAPGFGGQQQVPQSFGQPQQGMMPSPSAPQGGAPGFTPPGSHGAPNMGAMDPARTNAPLQASHSAPMNSNQGAPGFLPPPNTVNASGAPGGGQAAGFAQPPGNPTASHSNGFQAPQGWNAGITPNPGFLNGQQ